MRNKTGKRILCLALAALMFVLLPGLVVYAEDGGLLGTNGITTALAGDDENHWATPYIEKCHERGWMNGDGNGNFRPDVSITRGEFAVMLWRALGSPAPSGDCPFTDVPDDAYYRNAITALYEAGVVSGYGGGLFGPNDTLTREMAFVMLANAFDLAPQNAGEAAEYTTFDDYAQVSPWATDATSIMINKGYIEGSGNMLLPKKALTRGEMAKLLVTVYDGENAPPVGDEPQVTPDITAGPTLTLIQSPTSSTTGKVTISVTAQGDGDIAFIGWRSSSNGASYTGKTGFTDITSVKQFMVSTNGLYAVCAVDSAGNFSYKLAQITNIQASSSSGGGGGNKSPATVTDISISPATATVTKGGTQQFSATVAGTGNPSQAVTWAVEGMLASGTTIVGGLLTVDAHETATTLTVRATSVIDTSKSATAVVTVGTAPRRPPQALLW